MNDSPVAIFWDFENCSLALGRTGFAVARSIEAIAQKYGALKLFKAYLDAQKQPLGSDIFRAELQSSGVSVTDCPHIGRKEVADRMLQGDLMAFALDNPAPATVIIISADRDFAYAASVLRQRRYNVVMISHSNPRPNLWLTSQAIDCYDWKKDVLHVEERATTIPPILGKSVPSHAEVLAQCLAPIPIANGGKPTPTPPPPAPAPPAVAPQAAIKAANPPSRTADDSLSHIPPHLRCLVEALHKLAPKFGPVQRSDAYNQVKLLNPQCSRDDFKQLLRAGRASHLIKTGKKPQKWVSLRPESLKANTTAVQTAEELVDSGHESSSSDEDDAPCEVPVPLGFDVLVRALRDIGPAGDYRMKLGDVAVLIAKHNRRPYLLAGVGKLKAYLEAGERHGVVQRVGPKTTYLMGHVMLTDKYRMASSNPPPFIMTHSRRSSDTTVVSDSVEQASDLAEKPHSYVGSDSGFEEDSGAETTAPLPVPIAEVTSCTIEPETASINPPTVDEVVPLEPEHAPATLASGDIAAQAPTVPSGFDVLVRILQEVGAAGEYRMKSLDLAERMSAKHGRTPYIQAGVGKFSRYIELAASLGIVDTRGKKAKTTRMVVLAKAYREAMVTSPTPSEKSESGAPVDAPFTDDTSAFLETEVPATSIEEVAAGEEEEAVAEERAALESPSTAVNEPLEADTADPPLEVKTTPFSEHSSWAFELISPNPPEIEIDFSCTESLEALVASSNPFMNYDKTRSTSPAGSAEGHDALPAAVPYLHAPQTHISDVTTDVVDPTPSPPPSATAGDIDVLVDVLHTHAAKGFAEPLRSIVDFDLRYRLGWEGDLDGLFQQAEASGVIRTGVHRYSGLAWVALEAPY